MFTLKTLLETKPKFYLSTNINKFKLATKTNHSNFNPQKANHKVNSNFVWLHVFAYKNKSVVSMVIIY